jgi:hypothetical protein
MKKFLNNIKNEADHIRMSSAEKAFMRSQIFGTPSPVVLRKSPYMVSIFASHQFKMALAGVMLFILAGVGTASAAQGSLPGDLLYKVKLSVNEPIEVALAPNASAKAELQVALASRRVEEAQTLATEGRLDATTADTIATEVNAHAESAKELADSAEDDSPGTSAQVSAKLASALSVGSQVLKKLGDDSHNDSNKQESDSLATKVLARANGPSRAAKSTARAFSTLAAQAPQLEGQGKGGSTTDAVATLSVASNTQAAEPQGRDNGSRKVAAQLQKKAAQSLADAKDTFDRVRESFDATTTDSIDKQFASANAHMSTGSTELGGGQYAQATTDFTEALHISVRLSALLYAQKRFDNGILKALINSDQEDSGSHGGNGDH